MSTTAKSIKCGHCKGSHETTEQVRQCPVTGAAAQGVLARLAGQHQRNAQVLRSLGMTGTSPLAQHSVNAEQSPTEPLHSDGPGAAAKARPFDRPTRAHSALTGAMREPTDKALGYAKDRLTKRQWAPTKDALGAYTDHLSKVHFDLAMRVLTNKPISAQQCSDLIEALGLCPYKAEPAAPSAPQASEHKATATASAEVQRLLAEHKVPDGGYAVEDEDGTLHFYAVKVVFKDTGRRGLREQASDTLHRMYAGQQLGALRRIVEVGLKQAGERYAAELGMCYACRRTLTDETSRALGIGPICRGKGLSW